MVKVLGTGSYTPEKVITNDDLSNTIETSDEWIVQRTGIKARHVVAEGESTSDMAVNAARKALEMSNMTPEEIDIIIVATSTPDFHIPSTAPIVQNKLGCRTIPAFDINSVCAGFAYAFVTATSMLSSGLYKNCLVIGSDTYSKILNWSDRNTCVLFGDGAGAVVLQRDENGGKILSHEFGADGSGENYIKIPVGGARKPLHEYEFYDKNDFYFQMTGKKVYEFTITTIPNCATNVMQKAGLAPDELDLVVLHQANIRIIDAVAKRLGVDRERFFVNVEKYGNTSAASIPIALDEANRAGRIKDGDKILMLGFGGGLSWGGFIFQW